VSKFVIFKNNFQGTNLVMAHWLIFIMQGGNMGVLLMFGYGKKWFNFPRAPSLGWK
jgi:hypothetical protein